jgi:hypothetical protein
MDARERGTKDSWLFRRTAGKLERRFELSGSPLPWRVRCWCSSPSNRKAGRAHDSDELALHRDHEVGIDAVKPPKAAEPALTDIEGLPKKKLEETSLTMPTRGTKPQPMLSPTTSKRVFDARRNQCPEVLV